MLKPLTMSTALLTRFTGLVLNRIRRGMEARAFDTTSNAIYSTGALFCKGKITSKIRVPPPPVIDY